MSGVTLPHVAESTFACAALGRPHPYLWSLPAGEPPADGWPLVMLLPGNGVSHRAFIEDIRLFDAVAPFPCVVVFPAGDGAFYLDSPALPESRYQSMLCELLAHCRQTMPISPTPPAICGWSMGGYGAVRFALDYPHTIAAVASMIGLLDYPNPDLPVYPTAPAFGDDLAVWQQCNCLPAADRLRGLPVGIFAARDDWAYPMNVHFHHRLDALDIPHDYREYDGEHLRETVIAMLPDVMRFLLKSITIPPAPQ